MPSKEFAIILRIAAFFISQRLHYVPKMPNMQLSNDMPLNVESRLFLFHCNCHNKCTISFRSPPDFPLNNCEESFEDRATAQELSGIGRSTMGFKKFEYDNKWSMHQGSEKAIKQ